MTKFSDILVEDKVIMLNTIEEFNTLVKYAPLYKLDQKFTGYNNWVLAVRSYFYGPPIFIRFNNKPMGFTDSNSLGFSDTRDTYVTSTEVIPFSEVLFHSTDQYEPLLKVYMT